MSLYHDWSKENNRILYHENHHLIGKSVTTFSNPDTRENYLEFFEKYKCPGIVFLQSSRCDSNEQPGLKTTGLYDDL